MKLLVFSDSHGMPLYMRETLEKHRDVDAVIFLGDGQNDFQMMRALFPNIAFYSVRGNCDLGCADVPVCEILDLDGAKIFCTHGHLYHVKSGLYTVVCAAREAGANLLLFGHTHEADFLRMGDVTLFNPGSAGMGRQTYGMITVKGTEFQCEILSL